MENYYIITVQDRRLKYGIARRVFPDQGKLFAYLKRKPMPYCKVTVAKADGGIDEYIADTNAGKMEQLYTGIKNGG